MDRSRIDSDADLAVHPLEPGRVPDFDAVHSEAWDCGWCRCVAWWVPNWDGWGERSAEENRTLRDRLFQEGQYDGYLLYWKGEPVGWMQVGPVGRLDKLWRSYRLDELEVTPRDVAVSCVLLRPSFRGRGMLHGFLEGVIRDLETKEAGSPGQLLAFPRRGRHPDEEVWTGPDALFAAAGFRTLRADPVHPVLVRPILSAGSGRFRGEGWDENAREASSPLAGMESGSVEPVAAPRIVVFDLGGVLVDNAGIERLLDWAPHIAADELWSRWLASPSVRDFESGRTGAAAFAESLAREFALRADPGAIQREIASWIRGFFPGVAELLLRLRPQARLACLSNTNETHWERMLEEIDLYALLHHRFLSFRTGRLKPDPETFTHLLAELASYTGGRPERVIFFDDHPDNVAAARRHGIDARRTVGIDAVRTELVRSGFDLET